MKDVIEGNTARHIEIPHFDTNLSQKILTDVLKTIGDCEHLALPSGIRPHLVALIEASNVDFFAEHENAYWELYAETAELCRQGWRSFNYWISLEQTTCYKLYWELKRIAEKYNKPLITPQIETQSTFLEKTLKSIRGFFHKMSNFLHFHDVEYYRTIISSKDDQIDKNN